MIKNIVLVSALDIWSMGKKKGAQSLWKTLEAYAENGFQVYFITSNKSDDSIYNVHKNIKIIRFDSIFLKRLMNYKKIGYLANVIWWFYFQFKTIFCCLKINKETRGNLDLLYGYEEFAIPSTKFLSKLLKKPMVSRFQGTILLPKIGEKLWRMRYWTHYVAFKIPADLVIMTNDGTQGDRLLDYFRTSHKRVEFLMNGLDKSMLYHQFNNEDLKRELGLENKKILLTVSRLVNWKRVDRIINAMPQIIDKYKNIVLLIVGDGSALTDLKSLVDRLKLNQYVVFLGSIPHDKLNMYFSIADIFVSLYDLSNVGNPLLEAMMFGKCIVTLDNGDTKMLINDNNNGILLRKNELEILPDKINMLLQDKNYRDKLGDQARIFAEQNFWTWKQRMDYEIKCVSELINSCTK